MKKIEPTEPVLRQLSKPLVLVGLMGAGKTAIGKRLALRLDLPFTDVDRNRDGRLFGSRFFERYGEAEFRQGERRVLSRLLGKGPGVLATGGGAFMDKRTHRKYQEGNFVGSKPILRHWKRVVDGHRPLLKTSCPRKTLYQLLLKRYPVYANADITIISKDGPLDVTVDYVVNSLRQFRTKED